MPFIRVGRPLHLTAAEELKIVSYLTKVQSIEFGLCGTKIRRYSFQISKNKSKNCFNVTKEIAGFDWRLSLKERYEFSVRLPENLSKNRTAAVTDYVAVMSHIHVNELIENNETEVTQNETTVTENSDFQNGAFPKIRGVQKMKI
jgi:hypothetical protein